MTRLIVSLVFLYSTAALANWDVTTGRDLVSGDLTIDIVQRPRNVGRGEAPAMQVHCENFRNRVIVSAGSGYLGSADRQNLFWRTDRGHVGARTLFRTGNTLIFYEADAPALLRDLFQANRVAFRLQGFERDYEAEFSLAGLEDTMRTHAHVCGPMLP
jgi:hypothetical protein